MISLLFSTTFWYDVLIAAAIVLIIIACIKYPNAKWFVGTILAIALVTSSCYCAIQLNYYYTAEGGIYGKLSGIFNTNVVEVEELKFNFKNTELVKEHDDFYSAKITTNEVMKLSKNDNFMVYVNNEPCSISQINSDNDFITATYSYAFLDENQEILCHDTLTLNFAFYTNSSYISISTNGGAEAVKYWNYYFNKNVFEVEIKKINASNKDLLIGNGDISNYAIVTYIVNEDIYYDVALKGSYIILPNLQLECYDFDGWFTTDENDLKQHGESQVITEDITFTAKLTRLYMVTFNVVCNRNEASTLSTTTPTIGPFVPPSGNDDYPIIMNVPVTIQKLKIRAGESFTPPIINFSDYGTNKNEFIINPLGWNRKYVDMNGLQMGEFVPYGTTDSFIAVSDETWTLEIYKV